MSKVSKSIKQRVVIRQQQQRSNKAESHTGPAQPCRAWCPQGRVEEVWCVRLAANPIGGVFTCAAAAAPHFLTCVASCRPQTFLPSSLPTKHYRPLSSASANRLGKTDQHAGQAMLDHPIKSFQPSIVPIPLLYRKRIERRRNSDTTTYYPSSTTPPSRSSDAACRCCRHAGQRRVGSQHQAIDFFSHRPDPASHPPHCSLLRA